MIRPPDACAPGGSFQWRAGRGRGEQPFGSNGDVTLNAFVSEAASPFRFVTTIRGVPTGRDGSVSVIVCASMTAAPAVVPSSVTTAPVANPDPVIVISLCPSVVAHAGETLATVRPEARTVSGGPITATCDEAFRTLIAYEPALSCGTRRTTRLYVIVTVVAG